MQNQKNKEEWSATCLLFPGEVGSGNSAHDRSYKWLQKSKRADVAATRERLEAWFRRYPADQEGKRDFFRRFSSDDPHQHLSAYWELFCANLIQSENYQLEVHPPSPDTANNKHVDFKVSDETGISVYWECIATQSPWMETINTPESQKVISSFTEEFKDSDYCFRFIFECVSMKMPSINRMIKQIKKSTEENSGQEKFYFNIEDRAKGWLLKVEAKQKTLYFDAQDDAVQIYYADDCLRPNYSIQEIREKLTTKKPGYYGLKGHCYIIALHMEQEADTYHIEYALFGNISDGYRQNDGFFRNDTAVSAVLYSTNFSPFSDPSAHPLKLYINPFAQNPLPDKFFANFRSQVATDSFVVKDSV